MAAGTEITTMGEKGQVVIPQSVRKQLGVQPKTKFAVYGMGDIIVLKRLQLPDLREEWERVFRSAGRRRSRVSEAEVAGEVRAVRRGRRRGR